VAPIRVVAAFVAQPEAPAAVSAPEPAPPPAPVAPEPAAREGAALAERAGSLVRTAAPIDFAARHRAIVGARSFAALDAGAELLRATPGLELDVQVLSGHRSNPALHRALSERRAERVRAYLVSRGVEPERLRARGLGSACLDAAGAPRGEPARVRFLVVAAGEPGGECAGGR
jgi:OOP family OmpA-OmpF porin